MISHTSRLLIAVSVLALGPPSPAVSQRLVIPLAELSDDDLASIDLQDGYIDDWLRVVGDPTLTARDAYRTQGLSYWTDYDPSDLDCGIWLAWHDATNRIYVAFQRLDDRYENGAAPSNGLCTGWCLGSHDSSIQLWVDGDLQSKGLTSYEWGKLPRLDLARAAVREQQAYIGIAETHDSGPHLGLAWSYTDWMLHPPYGDSGGQRSGDNPIVTVLEFCFTAFDMLLLDDPEGSQATDLFPGKTIGLYLHFVDVDDGVPKWYSFGIPVSEFDLGPMSHGYLVGKPHVDQGFNRFPEATWATVKHASAVDSTAAGAPGD